MNMAGRGTPESAAELIDAMIDELPEWQGAVLSRVRRLIEQAVPDVVEEVKWRKPSNPRGVPVWSDEGVICTGEAYRDKVKLTFAHGASLEDPAGLFNASLGGTTRRAIDLRPDDDIDETAFKALIREASAFNAARASSTDATGTGKRPTTTTTTTKANARSAGAEPKLLAGGNPQIPKGDGDVPVQAYIAAMPGWKHDVGRRLDALIERTVPTVRKAVRWNSPFYGVEGQGWFLNFHCFAKYVKVAFFNGVTLRPVPPVESKHERVRYFHIHEDDEVDEARLAAWVEQASELPGEPLF